MHPIAMHAIYYSHQPFYILDIRTVPPNSKVCPFIVWFTSQPFTPGIGVGGKHPPVVCLVPEISLAGVPPWGLWYSQKLLNSRNWRLETIGYLKTLASLEKKPS